MARKYQPTTSLGIGRLRWTFCMWKEYDLIWNKYIYDLFRFLFVDVIYAFYKGFSIPNFGRAADLFMKVPSLSFPWIGLCSVLPSFCKNNIEIIVFIVSKKEKQSLTNVSISHERKSCITLNFISFKENG